MFFFGLSCIVSDHFWFITPDVTDIESGISAKIMGNEIYCVWTHQPYMVRWKGYVYTPQYRPSLWSPTRNQTRKKKKKGGIYTIRYIVEWAVELFFFFCTQAFGFLSDDISRSSMHLGDIFRLLPYLSEFRSAFHKPFGTTQWHWDPQILTRFCWVRAFMIQLRLIWKVRMLFWNLTYFPKYESPSIHIFRCWFNWPVLKRLKEFYHLILNDWILKFHALYTSIIIVYLILIDWNP